MVIPTVLALMLGGTGAAHGSNIELTPRFQPDPMVLNGTSGGDKSTPDCGNIAATPNYALKMSSDFQYLRFTLASSGQPTLLIQDPKGKRTCVSADSFSGGNIVSPGYWPQGTYLLYIGDRAGGHHSYTLSITQKPD